MALPSILIVLVCLFHPVHSSAFPNHHQAPSHSTYIVLVDRISKPTLFATVDQWYTSLVANTKSPPSTASIVHTYSTVLQGFAVGLTDAEARHMSGLAGVSGVFKERVYRTHTTRTSTFLGLDPLHGAWPESDFGDGVIIGFVDTGVWPEHRSFDDAGLAPVRSSWKGGCVESKGFNASVCNNKLVGAKAFIAVDGDITARDTYGHGTHVSSTAAGSAVRGANYKSFARGNAMGMAPKARIAMYKACDYMCSDSAIVAAVDAAVTDGVDILSMSLGDSDAPPPFYEDVVALATFGAERHGVFVVVSAGNSGPEPSTVRNLAPWMTTVGATTTDRVFPAKLRLGSGVVLTGQSLYDLPVKAEGESFKLVNSTCTSDSLIPDLIMGRLVLCLSLDGISGDALRGGAVGLVTIDPRSRAWDSANAAHYTFPALFLGRAARDVLINYLSSTAYPVGRLIFECATVIGKNRAPKVVGFSSRGPSSAAVELLKPDVVAPGLNVLAAWTGDRSGEKAHDFNIISGTSMACPHVAGVAALLKKKHPGWTPAMIRSALMTTAKTVDNTGAPIVDDGADDASAATPLVAGAGMVLPQSAMHPGLVYDAGTQEYVEFLCTLNYTAEQMRRFVPERTTNCTSTLHLHGGVSNLNYPSLVVLFGSRTRIRTLTRTVTKVSEQPSETYKVSVTAPEGVKVTVTPETLVFKQQRGKMSYRVDCLSDVLKPAGAWEFGSIAWKSVHHKVTSPIAFTWGN
uniref:Predicted protein n=1 Tax=Hordeum vulgare subsp. vulgare TaxID=112509 RepID=F2EHN2_HORVV|nr:predicted protein [Hordeum vulgare subsp. vulgare]